MPPWLHWRTCQPGLGKNRHSGPTLTEVTWMSHRYWEQPSGGSPPVPMWPEPQWGYCSHPLPGLCWLGSLCSCRAVWSSEYYSPDWLHSKHLHHEEKLIS